MTEKNNNFTDWAEVTINVTGLNTLKEAVKNAIDDNILTGLRMDTGFNWHDDRGNRYWCYCTFTSLDDDEIEPEARTCEFTLTHSTEMVEYTFLVTTKLKKDEWEKDEDIYYEVMDDFYIDNIEVADIYLHLD